MGFKHLVILGAGSIVATIPNGDKNGEKAFTLADLLTDPFLAPFVERIQGKCDITDVEKLCQKLYVEDKSLYGEFESLVREKYAKLELPNGFTILERLVLSLTHDDAIVSFNWDDLIVQAYNKALDCAPETILPLLSFPHGSAQAVYNKKRYGSKRNPDNLDLWDSPLNMPVDETDYKDNLFIQSQWRILDFYFRNARMITFFGYCGPPSDEKDMEHLESLIDANGICAKIEIIDKDLESAKRVSERLERFRSPDMGFYLCEDFWHSTIAKLPRRTISALENWNYTPREAAKEESLAEFMGHVGPLMEEELAQL
ncbi:MAG: hypothetical protein KAZ53_02490 [Prevotella sp.]|nr:hypothetical protein [Prevotella sp.]